MKKMPQITEAEYEVMKIIWHNYPISTNEITEQLAEAENMTLEDYRNYYHMADVEIHDYDGDQERLRIYQLMLLVLAVGAVAAGAILWSESRLGTQTVS